MRSVLFIHRRKIKSPNSAGKTEEHGNSFIRDGSRPVHVYSFEIRHKSDLSTGVHLNTKWVGVDYNRSAVEDKVGPSRVEP